LQLGLFLSVCTFSERLFFYLSGMAFDSEAKRASERFDFDDLGLLLLWFELFKHGWHFV
jgi:hypothetical protein